MNSITQNGLSVPTDAQNCAQLRSTVTTEYPPPRSNVAQRGYPDTATSIRPSFLAPHHSQTLKAITPDVIQERGYQTEVSGAALAQYGFCGKDGKPPKWVRDCVPALRIPVYNAAGDEFLSQIRPDNPRVVSGKFNKYETPSGFKMCVDVHPRIRKNIEDPSVNLWITEGVKKADSAISRGLCCVALLGVWNWRGTNDAGGATALPDWEHFAFKAKDGTPRKIYIVFDSDVSRKPEVQKALTRFVSWLEFRGAKPFVVYLPDGPHGEKIGLDDYFERGGTVEGLYDLVANAQQEPTEKAATEIKALTPDEIRVAFKASCLEISSPRSLQEVIATYRKHLCIKDVSSIEIFAGSIAANLMDGDPVWLMLVGASSGGKTEIVNPILCLPHVREAAVLTESSLLSGSSKRDRAENAKGGLLREIGPFGFLVLKDFTSVLSMNKDAKTATLAALREIYDGSWTRHVGSDGGQELQWKGKLATIACCTEAIDDHHAVIGAMGERFAFFRLPSLTRQEMAKLAISRTGAESQMRAELQEAVAGLFADIDIPAKPHDLSDTEIERLVNLADFASRCRSAVIRDPHTRDISLVLESEYPARLAKILRRLFSGMLAVGVSRERAWQIITKIGFDSMHKTRRQVVELLIRSGQPMTTAKIALALDLPTTTVRRALEELTAHKALTRDKQKSESEKGGGNQDVWTLTEWCHEVLDIILPGDERNKFFPEIRENIASDEGENKTNFHPNTLSDRKSGKNLDDNSEAF